MSDESKPPDSTHQHFVDPPYLVVTDRTTLPPRCIFSNEPVNESDYQLWVLPSSPRSISGPALASPILSLAQGYLNIKCRIRAGVGRRARRKLLLRKLAILTFVVSPAVLTATAIVSQNFQFLIAACAALVVVFPGVVILGPRLRPLRVHRQMGEQFWIAGCGPEFLASLSDELGSKSLATRK
jgi:hypothetical protein